MIELYRVNIIITGHVLALYHLANIYAKGLAGRRNCNQAVEVTV